MDKEASLKLTHQLPKVKAEDKAAENVNDHTMTRRVNYEDNIFYLILIFRGIAASLKLNIDAELYKDRIIEDIQFLDKTMATVFQSLRSNQLMIDRLIHLKELQKLNRNFIALLEDILEERLPLASSLEQDFDLLQRIQSNREHELSGLKEMIAENKTSSPDQEQIVSEEEFKYLLSPETDEEEQKGG